MARPIKETPVLKGKDAKRFIKAMSVPKPASNEEKEGAKEAYEWFKKVATFSI